MTDIRAAAREKGIKLSEVVILGDRLLGLTPDGHLMQWTGRVWRRLGFPQTQSYAARKRGALARMKAAIASPPIASEPVREREDA